MLNFLLFLSEILHTFITIYNSINSIIKFAIPPYSLKQLIDHPCNNTLAYTKNINNCKRLYEPFRLI